MLILTTLILGIFFPLTAAFIYSGSSYLPISSNQYPITSTVILDDKKMAFIKLNSTASVVTILQGDLYQNKIRQIYTKSSISAPKFINQDVVFNYGDALVFDKDKLNADWVFNYTGLGKNIVIGSGYILVPQQNSCATLIKLDYIKMHSQKILFEQGQNCTNSKYSFIQDLNNGRILFILGKTAYFINSTTLVILQKLQNLPFLTQTASTYIHRTNGDTTILLKKVPSQSYQYENIKIILNKDTGQYQISNTSISIQGYVWLTGTNSARSTTNNQNCSNFVNWKTLQNPELVLDFKISSQSLIKRKCIGISPSQNQFMVQSTQNNSLMLYTFNQDLSISYIKQFNQPDLANIIQSWYTKDGKYLIAITDQNYIKLDINAGTYQMAQKNSSCKSIKQIKNGKDGDYDVFVVACRYTSTNMYLELRNISTLELIMTYPLKYDGYSTYSLKLQCSNYWGPYFAVIFQHNITSSAVLLIIDNNTIKGTQISIQNLNDNPFQIGSAHEYLINFMYGQVTFYHYSNFSQIKRYNLANNGYGLITSYDDVLILQGSGCSYYDTYVYILSNPLSNWYIGNFRSYFYNKLKSSGVGYMIFPKRRLYYLYSTYSTGVDYPTKMITNISSSSIQEQLSIRGTLYIPIENLPQNYKNDSRGKCGLLLSLYSDYYNHQIQKFTDCKPYQSSEYYIFSTTYQINNKKIFYSQGYVIVYYQDYSSGKSQFIIRHINDLSKTLFQFNEVTVTNLLRMDVVADNFLVVVTTSGLLIYSLSEDTANRYQISNIITSDANRNGAYLFAGISDKNSSLSKIIYKNNKYIQPTILNLTAIIKYVALSQNSTYTATYSDNTTDRIVQIWTIVNNTFSSKAQYKYENITEIRFINDVILMIRQSNKIQLKDVSKINQIDNSNLYSSNINGQQFVRIAVSYDGQYIAKNTSDKTVSIVKPTGETVINFIVKDSSYYYNERIVDLAFANNGILFVISDQNHLYLYSPQQCTPPYIKTQYAQCTCKQNMTQQYAKCVCENKFIEDGQGGCKCPQNYTYFNPSYNSYCYCQLHEYNGRCYCYDYQIIQNGYCRSCNWGTYKVMGENRCQTCNIFCDRCSGPGFRCIYFSTFFYVIIVLSSVLFIAIVITSIVLIRRTRKGAQMGQNLLPIQQKSQALSQNV